MIQDETYYRIDLEDYSLPRFLPKPKIYVGTMGEIVELMAHLSGDSHTALRYGRTIEGVDRYGLEPEATHMVAGCELPVLRPVEVLLRRSSTVHNAQWLRAKASQLEVEQILVCDGKQLIRCGKFRFQKLRICQPGMGWFRMHGPSFRGFPGMMLQEEELVWSRLFSEMERYEEAESMQAIKDTNCLSEYDCELLCDDILGEI